MKYIWIVVGAVILALLFKNSMTATQGTGAQFNGLTPQRGIAGTGNGLYSPTSLVE